MSRVAFLVLGVFAFIFFSNALSNIQKRLAAPPASPSYWPEALTNHVEKVISNHPRHFISAQQALEMYHKNEAVFVDVRSPREQAISTIPGALTVQPQEDPLNDRAPPWNQLGTDKIIIVYCTLGERSGQLKDLIKEKGWWAYNLIGGICAWSWEKGPLHDSSNKPTQAVHVWSQEYKECLSPEYLAVTD